MSEPTTYEIRTVADFLKVPEPRWAACLEEFLVCLACAAATADLLDAVGESLNATAPPFNGKLQVFRWTDDGQPGLSGITINLSRATPKEKP